MANGVDDQAGTALGDGPTWNNLRALIADSSLRPAGKTATTLLLRNLEDHLGRNWPRRLRSDRDYLFPALLTFSSNVFALYQFATFATQLSAVVEEPTFAPVRQALRTVSTTSDWYHTSLQLEVARVARAVGWGATFEPPIPGSVSKGDVLLSGSTLDHALVETTTLFRSKGDLELQAFGEDLNSRFTEVAGRYAVHAVVELHERIMPDAVEEWVSQVECAAHGVGATGVPRTVTSWGGSVRLQKDPIAVGTDIFRGVPHSRDEALRFGRKVAEKARQSSGPYPAWLRVDARDGLFGFTDWSRKEPARRVADLAAAIRPYVEGREHLHGVVCSSGPLPVWGVTDPAVADISLDGEDGLFVRRLVAPHVARETIIVSLRGPRPGVADIWSQAYADESRWLDEDLRALGLPPFASYWP